MKSEKDAFVTQDLYLSCAISILLNLEPILRIKNGRTVFCFAICDDLYKAITAYNNGIPLNAYEYAGRLKRMRGEMITKRNERGTNDGR